MLEKKCRVGYCLMNALLPHQLLTSMQLHKHVQRGNKNGCCRNFKAALVGTLSILMVYLIPTLLVIKCRYRSTCLSLLVFLYILNKDCILAIHEGCVAILHVRKEIQSRILSNQYSSDTLVVNIYATAQSSAKTCLNKNGYVELIY